MVEDDDKREREEEAAEEAAAPDAEPEARAAEGAAPPPDEVAEPKDDEAQEAEAEEEQPEPEPEAEADEAEPEPEQPPAKAEKKKPAKPAGKPAAKRGRSERAPGVAPPIVRARARYVRSAPRKARLVSDHIRGKSVEEARAILAHTARAAARDWSKLLESAVANAENNHELVGDDLRVKAVYADEGPTLKRYRPRAMGRATRIRKRTSHLTIELTPKE